MNENTALESGRTSSLPVHNSYTEARAHFLRAATNVGARIESVSHAHRGPLGETLAVDAAWVGPAFASKVLIVTSGVHGIEGFAGSALQAQLLHDLSAGKRLPEDTALFVLHAVNPWGMAWGFRENEDNVDLNRNFRDFAVPLAPNDAYGRLHPLLALTSPSGAAREAADRELAAYLARHGESALIAALAGGQYSHADGFYYGGATPVWSRLVVESLLGRVQHVAHALLIDLHTGLGPFGHGTLISFEPADSPWFAFQLQSFGRTLATVNEKSSGIPEIQGSMVSALRRILPGIGVTGLALEFGTLSWQEDLTRHREAMWLRHHGNRFSAEGRRILDRFREYYFPASADWLELIAWRARMVFRQSFACLRDTQPWPDR